jgi:hypothetical protein
MLMGNTVHKGPKPDPLHHTVNLDPGRFHITLASLRKKFTDRSSQPVGEIRINKPVPHRAQR